MHPDAEHATTIVLAHLAGNTAGLSVGDAEAPENPTPAFPYLVLSPLTPFSIEGSLAEDNEIHSMEWQVTSVGKYRIDAQGGLSAARDRMVDKANRPDFTAMTPSYKLTGSVKIVLAPGLEQENTEKPPLFLANETYRLMLVPA